jgi:ATP-dependent Clp protease ATP-binding subunit ClpA
MNKLDPVIGRDDEISRILQILSRRTKNKAPMATTELSTACATAPLPSV